MVFTIRDLKALIADIEKDDPNNLDCPVVMPKIDGGMAHMFVFEGVCPAVTDLIQIGPAPDYMADNRGENKAQPMWVLLIAPHSFHDDNDPHEKAKKEMN